jgi:glycosyltransferase involved in cell wall biosynthesis
MPRLVIATVLRGNTATGVDTHAREIRDYISSRGGESEMVTSFSFMPLLAAPFYAPGRLIERWMPAAGVWWYRWSRQLFLHLALRRQLRHRSDTVVYAQCPVSAQAALRARRTRAQKVVMAVHFHGSQADEWSDRGVIRRDGWVYRGIRRFEQRIVPAVDGLVCVSESARAGLRAEVARLDEVPSVVVPNFVQDRPGLQRSMPGTKADLVTVGSLELHKNHEFLLEVLAEAVKLGRHYSLDLIGRGSQQAILAAKARALGIAGQVRFVGQHPDPRSLLPGHKLYVHASSRETGPLAVVEAMSAGIPVVAPPVGAVPDILSDGRCGRIWSLEDPAAAAAILVELLDDPRRLAEMARASRARFLEYYTTEISAQKLVTFTQSIASGSLP